MDGHGGGVDNYLLNFLENVHTQDIEVDLLTNSIDKELEKISEQISFSYFCDCQSKTSDQTVFGRFAGL